MNLHIIRHAKTNQISPTGRDFDRELLPRGEKQCATLKKYLADKNLNPLLIYCSEAKRTKQTFERIEIAFKEKKVVFEKSWHLCDHQTWLKVLWNSNQQEDIVIVGHNFGKSDLASYFIGRDYELATSEYLCISFPFQKWSEVSVQTGTIVDQFRPDDQ